MGFLDNVKNFLGRVLLGIDLKEREAQLKKLKNEVKTLKQENIFLKEENTKLKQENNELKKIIEQLSKKQNLEFFIIVDFQVKAMKGGSISDFNLEIKGVVENGISEETILSHYNNKITLRQMLSKAINLNIASQQILNVDTKAGMDFKKTEQSSISSVNCILTINDGNAIPFNYVNDIK
jgi:predicted nuclease with TOPRIM domain